MADRTLCMMWSQVVRGREARSLEVFNDSVGWYSALREEGRIAGFDLVLLTPNGTVDGMILLHGTHAQLDAIREEERFQRLVVEASLIVDDLRVIEGYANEGIAAPMSRFQEAVAHADQPAHA